MHIERGRFQKYRRRNLYQNEEFSCNMYTNLKALTQRHLFVCLQADLLMDSVAFFTDFQELPWFPWKPLFSCKRLVYMCTHAVFLKAHAHLYDII